MPFKLHTHYEPAGGQPEAITNILEHYKKGEQKQTLLGITGSGKSVDGEEMLLIQRADGSIHKITIGEYANNHFTSPSIIQDTQYQDVENDDRIVSFCPEAKNVSLQRIKQVSKHAENKLFKITLDDGTQFTATKDHSCFTFDQLQFNLKTADQLKLGDWIPSSNRTIRPDKALEYLDITELTNTRINIKPIIEKINQQQLKIILRKKYHAPNNKISQIHNQTKNRSLTKELFFEILQKNNIQHKDNSALFTTRGKDTVPTIWKITHQLMNMFGLYVAEGGRTKDRVHISNSEQHLQQLVKVFCEQFEISTRIINGKEINCYSKVLSDTMSHFGTGAHNKNIPEFIFNCSDKHVCSFLQAVFDGDGWVEKHGVYIGSASRKLIDDMRILLLRMGISTRVRVKKTTHRDAYILSITGACNIKLFSKEIGFSIDYKQDALLAQLDAEENTNVDIVPSTGLGTLRKGHKLYQHQIATYANCSQALISMVELGQRNLSQRKMSGIAQQLLLEQQDDTLMNLWQFSFHKIISIEEIAPTDGFVYDIAVENNETFAVGGGNVLVHNTFVMAHVIQALKKKTLILAHNKTLAAQLYAELTELFPDNKVEYFVSYYDYYQPESYLPTTDTYIEKDASRNDVIDAMRLRATANLMSRDDVIVVASVSCIYGLGDPNAWEKLSVKLTTGNTHSRDDIIRGLVEIQYERNDTAPEKGQFRVQGDTLEIYIPYEEEYIRVELFGDDIERITRMHKVTREELNEEPELVIFPAKHFVTGEEQQQKAIQTIKEELEEVLPTMDDPLAIARLKQRTKFDLEMIEQLGYCSGIENYSRHFSGRKPGSAPHTLIDFFGDDWLLIIDESHVTLPQVHAMKKGDESRKRSLIDYGFRLPSAYDNRPLSFEEFEERMPTTLFVSATPGQYELDTSTNKVELIIRPTGLVDPCVTVKPTQGQIDDLIEEVRVTLERKHKVFVTTLTKKMAEDLTNYLAGHNIRVRYLHSEIETLERQELLRQLRADEIDVLVGINLLREGLDVPEVELVAILDADKEGFLRNERSLLQTIGRAARNSDGRVVMYADKVTDSMQRAITITHERREVQEKWNAAHGVTPKTIIKKVPEQRVAMKDTKHIPDADVMDMIEAFTEEMAQAAESLDFELAIEIRDRIRALEKRLES